MNEKENKDYSGHYDSIWSSRMLRICFVPRNDRRGAVWQCRRVKIIKGTTETVEASGLGGFLCLFLLKQKERGIKRQAKKGL